MDHNGLLNGPSPYADTAEERPLGIEYQVSWEMFQTETESFYPSGPPKVMTRSMGTGEIS